MPFKLSPANLKTKQRHIQALETAYAALEGEVARFNEALRSAASDLEQARSAYDWAVSEARTWIADMADEWRGHLESKSETWQDSERGSAASDLIDAWNYVDLSDADFDIPDPIALDIEPGVEALRELPDGIE